MDSAQVMTLVTGSGGALVFAVLWIRSLQKTLENKDEDIKMKDQRIEVLTERVVSLATDVQRSIEEKTGCRYREPSEK
jgi:hypothetical protein